MACVVRACGHYRSNSECRMYNFPKDDNVLKKWRQVLQFSSQQFSLMKQPRVCSCHFKDGNKENLPSIRSGSEVTKNIKRKPLSELYRQNKYPRLLDARKPNDDDKSYCTQTVSTQTVSTQTVSTQTVSIGLGSNINSRIDDCSECNETNSDQADEMLDWKSKFEETQSAKDDCLRENKKNEVEIKYLKKLNNALNRKVSSLMSQIEYSKNLDEMNRLRVKNSKLQHDVDELTSRLMKMNLRFEFTFIEDIDEKVYQHTGLPSKKVFDLLFQLLTTVKFRYYLGWAVLKIPARDQLLIALMKLKMNLRHFDLAQRFGCSSTTVTNIVSTWLLLMHEVLYRQLMQTIPSRQRNKKCLPIVFQTLSDCRMVLDGVEMFCDKPMSMLNQKAAYSGYKHHCTCKGLVGIAPNGFVTYVSELYPGSTSDKKLVQACGVLQHFVHGDMILTDKGFLIADILPYGVDLNMPPFLTTQQFTPEQVKQTERIARARVHVERAINKIKNFKILSYIPSEMNVFATEIFQVCAALTNLQNPVISEIAPLV